MQVHGVDIDTYLYVHFEMPLNWEEIITPQERQMLDDDRAGGGVDSVPTEIIHHDVYTMMWSEGDHEACLQNPLAVITAIPKEDLDLIMEEWILAVQGE